jgi:K+-transporting ATPase ATPase C chain
MSEIDEPIPKDEGGCPSPPHAMFGQQIVPALLHVFWLTLLTGAAFPLILAVLAWPLFSHQANGSRIEQGGQATSRVRILGSEFIGQIFAGPGYFHPRPSAAGDGYDATASGGTNLGPANPKLRAAVRQRAEEYRRRNRLSPDTLLPIDGITFSGSGLDPHISPANAALQVRRVALERQVSEETVQHLVDEYTAGRQFGLLGEPRVCVLTLNLALDRLAPLSATATGN